MTGIAEDYDSSVHLVIEAHQKLQKKNPNHELLRLITLHEDKRGFDMSPDFYDKCLPPDFNGSHVDIHALGNYSNVLDNVARGLPYELPPVQRPASTSEEPVFYESLDELFDR